MSQIVILDEKTANQIAAGEVIERPASVVKEMVENAIDAGATQITVEIKNGGVSYIRITDNGKGMDADDVEIAFERHATSKIRRIEDLDGLATMGFRGEALASIASVSHLEVTTKTPEAPTGTVLKMEGGRVTEANQTGSPNGTTFIVKNLFYNTPARYKFLKKDTTEAGYVSDIMERLALAHPGIAFKFIQNHQVQLHTPGNHELLSVIYSIYGKEIAKSVLPVHYESEGLTLSGFVGKPEIARGTRNSQSFFLNGRYIKSRIVTGALEEAYKTLLMQNKFPFCVLLLKASPEGFDVNVHPQKLEVRFANEGLVFSTVYHGVKNTLLGTSLNRSFEPQKTTVEQQGATSHQAGYTIKPQEVPTQTTLFEAPKKTPVQNRPVMPIENGTKGFEPKHKPYPVTSSIQPATEWRPSPPTEPLSVESVPHHSVITTDENATMISEEAALFKAEPGTDKVQPDIGAEELSAASYEAVSVTKDQSLQHLLEASIVGQAFDTYILLQNGDTLYIIDQHAAHERIRYETLKQRMLRDESYSQVIMEPFIITLHAKEFAFVMEKQSSFQKLGFDLEAFGPNTIILRSIPDFYDSSFNKTDFHEILDRWIQTNANESGISDEALYMMSCKGALKANKALSKEEIRGLVASLCAMENPYTCVHGRPVIISTHKREFEKRFKRIV